MTFSRRDAILETFNLPFDEFEPLIEENERHIDITVSGVLSTIADSDACTRQSETEYSRRMLGFIRYKKQEKTLRFAIFKATLTLDDLDIGRSSNGASSEVPTALGRGLKLAALEFCRHRLEVRCETGSCYWRFSLYNGDLRCQIIQHAAKKLSKKKEAAKRASNRGQRGLQSNVWEDVAVVINDKTGVLVEDTFRDWLKISLDFHCPKSELLIRTSCGDLILDDNFAGKLYLRRLRARPMTITGHPYKLGYNFHVGQCNRDNELSVAPFEQARSVTNILEQALCEENPDQGLNLIERYLDLFLFHPHCADLAYADELVSDAVTDMLWEQVQARFPGCFFYAKENDRAIDGVQKSDIQSSLGRPTEPLPETLWRLLRKHAVVRTPKEEVLRCFRKSRVAPLPERPFGRTIHYSLKASLKLNDKTSQIDVSFVHGELTNVNLSYDEEHKVLRVQQRWADYTSIHAESPCDLSRGNIERTAASDTFLCDHVAEELVELAIDALRDPLSLDQAEYWTLRRHSRENIHQMPRKVQLSPTDCAGQLRVSWLANDGGAIPKELDADASYTVILHRTNGCNADRCSYTYDGGMDILRQRKELDNSHW